MNLYFYRLKENKVTLDICEVEEKPRTYRPVNRFPRWFYRSFVRKEEIGRMTRFLLDDVVILTEKDDKRAYSVFAGYVRGEIEKNKGVIRSTEKDNERLERALQILESF